MFQARSWCFWVLPLVLAIASAPSPNARPQLRALIQVDPGQAPLAFAADELKAAFERRGTPVALVGAGSASPGQVPMAVVLATVSAPKPNQPVVSGLTAQGYALRRVVGQGVTTWWVIGADAAGAMYGGLELAEHLRTDGSLERVVERQINPRIAQRGIKFNIPLDARTPSYSDDSTSAQANIPEM